MLSRAPTFNLSRPSSRVLLGLWLVWMGQPIRRVLFPRTVTGKGATAIHLRTPLPTPSSGLPGHSGEQPSIMPCLALLRVGFT